MRRVLLVIGVMLAAIAPVRAQSPELPTRESVARLLDVMEVEQVYRTNVTQASLAMREASPALSQMAGMLEEVYAKHASWSIVEDDYIRTYQSSFSQSEVDAMIAFYSGEGRGLHLKQSRLTTEMARVINARIQPHLAELMQQVQLRVRARDP